MSVTNSLDNTGDQLNLIPMLDQKSAAAVSRLAPHLWAFSLDEPHTLSGNLELQGPVVDTVANWLHQDYLNKPGK